MIVPNRARRPARRHLCRPRAAALALALLAAGATGCTREFFREWADQDVTEAVFEKSRDPRWRMDTFTKEPPQLARFAQPYDPDRPPAPPDDYPTESLSPTPQWPIHRLLVPVEGTGYLDMIRSWQRQPMSAPGIPATVPVAEPRASEPVPTGPLPAAGGAGAEGPATGPPPPVEPPPPPTEGRTPFPAASRSNSGPKAAAMSPILVAIPGPPPAGGRAATAAAPSRNDPRTRDPGVRQVGFQATDNPRPGAAAAGAQPGPAPVGPAPPEAGVSPGQGEGQREPIRGRAAVGGDQPTPGAGDASQRNLLLPTEPMPGISPLERAQVKEETGSLIDLLVPASEPFDDASAAGLPRGTRPYVINPEQAMTLALINSRPYQYQLEQVYLASLNVTLQRFNFEPQFYAGMGPLTGPAGVGIPQPNPTNQYVYRTNSAPGGGVSNLQLGTVAGVGKLFSNGVRLLTGFANQTVFNFNGSNGTQPSVQSTIPIAIVLPLLRGGGRAVTLEGLTQAERSLLYQIRAFARFRQEFVANVIAQAQAITNPGTGDPVVGYLNVMQQLQQIENDRLNIKAFEQLLIFYREQVAGNVGIGQQQVDQLQIQLETFRLSLITDLISYRNLVDSYKIQLGLPPDLPVVFDRSLLDPFRGVFVNVDRWSRRPDRQLNELPGIVDGLPDLQDVQIDGYPLLKVVINNLGGKDFEGRDVAIEDTTLLNSAYLAAERIGLESRLDLMSARAQLYDAWRQYAVLANALKGFLNFTITNQVYTPPTTTNPFGFFSQAKQFSGVMNAELPLIRVSERNNYIANQINYERQRRNLMLSEDQIKFQVRQDIRNLLQQAQSYDNFKKRYVLTIRAKDQTVEQLVAPAQVAAAGASNNAATQTINLTNFQATILNLQNTLIQTWVFYLTQRITLFRDLGIMPLDEWEAFHELIPPKFGTAGAAPVGAPGPRPAAGGAPGAAAARPPGRRAA
ncbi:MAG TPA: hypothetical protein VG406_13240 [Isosphaeraceae bacterium]|jgi:hypothetical protein|nr:hypothetical protein [Isosphaeraceae bacterium]